ncbi:MAG TPA: accessory factor UbiK family protein [Chromatiales bacterium]|nr:accessory factor UbiK family protein [Chromatiales bacterium]
MIDPGILDDLARRLARLAPPGAEVLREDLERNLHAALRAALARLDLVTREEFDAQARVLARTRERLEALERRVAALEAASAPPPSGEG